MSISYGNFSSPLKHIVTSGAGSGLTLFFTIPWASASYVDRLRVWTSGTNKIDSIQISTDNAHLASGSPDESSYYLWSNDTQLTFNEKSGYSITYDLNPSVHHVNLYNRPYLNVRVILNATSTDTFYCYAEGRKSYSTNYERTDKTNLVKLNDYRVLLGKAQSGNGGTGGVISDITNFSINNSVNAEEEDFTLNSANDYIYIGSKTKLTHWELGIGTGSTTATATKGEYWSGSTWTAFNVLSNIKSNNSNTLRYSGVLEGSGLGSSAWVLTKLDPALNIRLPNDPKTALQNSITNGDTKPISFFENEPKFWVRFSFTGLTDKIYFNKVLPVGEEYSLF